VIIAFVATAGITLVLSVVALLIDAFCGLSYTDKGSKRIKTQKKQINWRKIVERLVLSLSDQQLVTGTAILCVGLYCIPASRGHISFYHFTLVTDLAWFSSNTHQLAVMVLRNYFEKYYVLKIWRGLSMLVMGLLLAICTGLTSVEPPNGVYNCPAECVIHDFSFSSLSGRPLGFMIVNLLFLLWGYSVALGPLFRWSTWLANRLKCLILWPCLCHETCVRFIGNLLWTKPFKMAFSMAFFALGLYELLADRRKGQGLLAADQSEDQMSFGQIVPLALLVLPILSGLETYYGTSYETLSLPFGRSV
jgi:hypothetical protein